VEVDVGPITHRPRPALQLTLAVALPKATRQDVMFEKCTELGVAAILPLVTERSISGASEHRLDKWRRTAIEAAKQSGQAWIPELTGPTPLAQVIATFGSYETVCVATAEASQAFQPPATGRVLVLIGPEGDWTPRELEQMQAAGAAAVSLGPNVLRVETAAIAVAARCHLAALSQPQEPAPAAGTHV
jgi:16S rRNA (uracil1498-N3)-methyltransferase